MSVGQSAALAVACAFLASCQPKENPVLSNENFPGERYEANMVLSDAQQAAVVFALRGTAEGESFEPMTSAPDAVRWSDVPAAANAAVSAAEMGIATSTLAGETWTFDLRTQGGEPAQLVVVRRAPPEMYLATAAVGSFGERFNEAERIVREFRMAMRRFGALKRPS